ncbi:MAG TPA: NAD-dependent epimerase/dehydratase family protein [Bryobacterales bacterium]|nr:NAD-dependent epimerase/dehydratase family protein [Bryobacterales bacterium]
MLVIGGTLFIGKELVRRLVARGDRVTILHRGRSALPAGTVEILCDRNDADAVRRALRGRSFDLVFDNVYDWQHGTTAEQVAAAAEACGDKLERYVFISSVAAYGEGTNLREDAPLAAAHEEAYIRNKARTEQMLFRLHHERGFPAVTLRPPYVYGPENPFYREAFFWDRISQDRPVIVPDDGSRLMQFVYVKDLVGAMLAAAAAPTAIGQTYNIANQAPVTQVEAVQALAAAAGREARLVFVPRARIQALGGNVFEPPFYFGQYFDLPGITMSIEKARRDLCFHPTPFADGLAETYQWYASRPHKAEPDFSFDDRLLAAAGR